MKLAFACIVRGADDEAKPLKHLLASIAPHVDAMYVTVTQPNKKVIETAEFFGANVSHFEWCNNFAKARRFNFAQVPKEYDYIMWGDADDTFENIEGIKDTIEQNPADAYAMFYFYDFDKYGLPTVVHAKTQIVKHDGSFEWRGAIHEDLQTERKTTMYFLKGVKRIHHPTNERVNRSSARNLAIAETGDKRDPRTWWNIANGHASLGQDKESRTAFETFLETSQSDGEKYIALLRLAYIDARVGGAQKGIERARQAIAIRYDYPDAYFTLGELLHDCNRHQEAVDAVLEGLKKKPPVHELIVFNPRDYDYNPLMLLAKIYWTMSKPDQALTCLKKCKEIQPKNLALDTMIENAEKEAKDYEVVLKTIKKLSTLKTTKAKLSLIDKQTEDVRKHPLLLRERNLLDYNTTSSGRDLVYFCGYTERVWTPESVKEGIGGSEEAVIHLSKEFAKNGWNVTVYNNCGEESVHDGVTYKPWYLYNLRNKVDVLILWRHPGALDHNPNADKILLDLHDTVAPDEFLENRVKKLDKIFVKSQAHRELYPKIPDEKFVILPNAIVPEDFAKDIDRDPFLIINTSSPERGLKAAVRVFKKVKEKEPRAKMKWAYGWDVYEAVHATDKRRMDFKRELLKEMEEAGVENMGKISHKDVATMTMSAGIMLYPTHFHEIDCVSLRKAQLGGAVPVTTDFAAIKETVQHGYKVPTKHTKDTWAPPYVIDFSEEDDNDDAYVEAVLQAFEWRDEQRQHMRESARKFTRAHVAGVWIDHF